MLDRILYSIAIIGWLAVIFMFSNMPSQDSNGKSKELIRTSVVSGSVILQELGIFKEVPSKEKIEEIVSFINYPVRKLAHFSIYFVLGMLIMISLRRCTKLDYYKVCIIAAMSSFLYSLTDELHQKFISGRTGQFTDCLIDTLGAISAILLYSFVKELTKVQKVQKIE